MSDGKHTLGPWTVNRPHAFESIRIEANKQDYPQAVAVIQTMHVWNRKEGSVNEIIEANAALIAAAPDLLEALEFFIDDENPCRYDHNGRCQEHGGMISGKCANALAMAVVAKAKGETK